MENIEKTAGYRLARSKAFAYINKYSVAMKANKRSCALEFLQLARCEKAKKRAMECVELAQDNDDITNAIYMHARIDAMISDLKRLL